MAGYKARKKQIMPDTPAPPGHHWMVGKDGKPYLMKGSTHAEATKRAKKKRRNTSSY